MIPRHVRRQSLAPARKRAYAELGNTRREQCLTLLARQGTMTLTQLGNAIGADTMGLGNTLLAAEKKGQIVRVPKFGPNGGFGWKLKVEPMVELLKEIMEMERSNPVAEAIAAMRKLLAKPCKNP